MASGRLNHLVAVSNWIETPLPNRKDDELPRVVPSEVVAAIDGMFGSSRNELHIRNDLCALRLSAMAYAALFTGGASSRALLF